MQGDSAGLVQPLEPPHICSSRDCGKCTLSFFTMLVDGFDYKELVIAISVLLFILHTYLDVRQLKVS